MDGLLRWRLKERARSVGPALLVLVFFSALTALVTFPGVLYFRTHFWGMGDLWTHLWNFWWYEKALTELHRSPYVTDYMYYPTGASLASQTFSEFNVFLGLPLRALFGPVVAYNLLVFFAYVVSGVGAYLLVRHITGSRAGGLVAGIAFAFAPFRVGHIMFFHIQSTEWIPFFCWSLLRLWERPSAGNALLAGLFLALAALCTWYYLLFLGLWSLLFLLYHAIREPVTTFNRRFLKHALLAAGVAGLLVLPFLYPLLKEMTSGASYLRMDFSDGFSADLLSLVIPPEFHPFFGKWLGATYRTFRTDYRERVNSLGWVALALGLYAFLRSKNELRRTCIFWWGCLLSFSLLALGPRLVASGQTVSALPLPYALLKDLPAFNVMRAPTRFVVLASLAVAVVAGIGTALLTARLARPILRRALALVVMGLVLFESWTWPVWPLSPAGPVPWFYTDLAREPGDFAILEIPLPNIFHGPPFYYQTFHQKKLVGGNVPRPPREAEAFVAGSPFLSMVLEPHTTFTGFIYTEEAENAYEILTTLDIRWIVLNLGSETAMMLANWFTETYGRAAFVENGFAVFRVRRDVPKERFLQSSLVRRATPEDVYRSEIFGLSGYKIKLARGDYRVCLKFAETFFRAPGERVFDVRLEGRAVLTGFDIVQEVGAFRPVDKTFDVSVEDGVLEVDFVPVRNLAKLSGLEVRQGDRIVFQMRAAEGAGHPWDGNYGYTGAVGFYRTRVPVSEAAP